MRRLTWAGAFVLSILLGAFALPSDAKPTRPPTGGGSACAPGTDVTFEGVAGSSDAGTYRVLPFTVDKRTTRVEVTYDWADNPLTVPSTPATSTVFDLGLWDEGGVGTVEGFRGWSGSRGGRVAAGQDPVFVQADTAARGYRPGPVRRGTWAVDLGIAAVKEGGARWTVTVRCLRVPVGEAFIAQPVDRTHVANPAPGWYHGDFHMHGYHSHRSAPAWQKFVDEARAAGLDFLPITEYVTDQHHRELGPIQAANPDVLLWPGREIITYYGHANALGETPSVVDWRHGYTPPGGATVTLAQIQRLTKRDGALFQVNHPTFFPTPLFASFCRGCEFRLGEVIDWAKVDTMELLTGPVLAGPDEVGLPSDEPTIENPFVTTAIELWERKLMEGYKVTAVSGSDAKLPPGWGSSATAVHARELSRAAIIEGIRAGHAYIRTHGAAPGSRSPSLELTAVTADGQRGMFGDTLRASEATVTVRVRGGDGQVLRIVADRVPVGLVPITGDDFTHTFTARALPTAGPLGSFWRIETLDTESRTTLANPLFLRP